MKFVGIALGFVNNTRGAAGNASDRSLVLDGGYLQFRIVDKDLLFVPLLLLPVINPFAAISTTANNTTINGDNPGGGQGVPMFPLPINITLNPYENFTCAFNFDGTITLAASLDAYVFLLGYQRRPT